MAEVSKFKVPLAELTAVHVPVEDLVEEQDPTPPNPDAKSKGERDRESAWKGGAAS